ncbi:hypothetical protein OG730_34870 [Streptomyces sp. NBC_01298]|uniref:hypothetical protein n=1 Tax=Streptomyces sp. NBC_01298 TaxID=2903817 RepID=UPI002E146788|nr:hypothetical protein OG730_34870 [Streptomyces sp. NBC_01298]
MPETTWPEGVIARYLTVTEATVDLTHTPRFYHGDEVGATVASCTGCGKDTKADWVRLVWDSTKGRYTDRTSGSKADTEARKWAQDHAETCRAMPRPTA